MRYPSSKDMNSEVDFQIPALFINRLFIHNHIIYAARPTFHHKVNQFTFGTCVSIFFVLPIPTSLYPKTLAFSMGVQTSLRHMHNTGKVTQNNTMQWQFHVVCLLFLCVGSPIWVFQNYILLNYISTTSLFSREYNMVF